MVVVFLLMWVGLVLVFIFNLAVLFIALSIIVPMVSGAPFMRTRKSALETVFGFADIKDLELQNTPQTKNPASITKPAG